MQDFSNGGNAPQIEDVFVIAFYDPKTGRIAHTHTSVVFEGGRKISQQEATTIAQSHATQRGHNIKRLKMATSKIIIHGMAPHTIDLKTKTFKRRKMPRSLLTRPVAAQKK